MSVNKKCTRRFHFVPALVVLGVAVAFGSVADATVHYRLSEERFKYVAFDASSQVLYAAKERGTVIDRWEMATRRALESVQSPVDRSEIVWIAPQIDLARTTESIGPLGRQQWFEEAPLIVRQVRGVGFTRRRRKSHDRRLHERG